jgi:hypothetical protein
MSAMAKRRKFEEISQFDRLELKNETIIGARFVNCGLSMDFTRRSIFWVTGCI